MVVTKVQFIFSAFAFVFLLTQIGAIMGVSLVTGYVDFVPPSPPTNVLGLVLYIIQNIGFFFVLMTVSSAYQFLGFIVIILSVGIVWCVLELIAEAIP